MLTAISRIYTLLLAIIIMATATYAQTADEMQTRPFELAPQLPSTTATFTFQDNDGIIWLCTR